jgi:aldose 1-epimerase
METGKYSRVRKLKFMIEKQLFGKMPNGADIYIYTLANSSGAEVRITNYAGILVSLKMPDRDGNFDDVLLGYDDLQSYLNDNYFMGALVGRFCNRIAAGKFSLNGKKYTLEQNRGGNHLHGGSDGFYKKVWQAKERETGNGPALELSYFSPDGEQDYPGNLTVKVVYTLTEENELKIEYSAVSDKDTIINLTNHAYFNLGGAVSEDISGHQMYINAGAFLPVDETLIPTGELRSVKGTPMDFTEPMPIGKHINDDYKQLKLANGYDQNWVLNKTANELSLAARIFEPVSGRVMEVRTTQPGMQFYSGNRLENMHGKNGRVHQKRAAMCLETQHFPDSPNKPHFPSAVLRAGEELAEITIYKFLTDQN